MDISSRLMRRRVRTVLVFGSRYDAFIMREAGFVEPGEPPSPDSGIVASLLQAETKEGALALLGEHDVDLVMSALRPNGQDAFEVVRELKASHHDVPMVLVTSEPAFHGPLSEGPPIEPFDGAYAWNGETDLLRAIVMATEDRLNAEHDLREGGVRLILLVEDEPALYSRYLPMVYDEICSHVRDLIPEGSSPEDRAMRERARAKVLLATSYEEALIVLARYGDAVCGILSDLQYPRDGRAVDPHAGLHLARYAKYLRPSIPVVIQSRDRAVEAKAHQAGAFFIWKDSDNLLRKLRTIMNDFFGFGDFVFRDPEGVEQGRARDLRELASMIDSVPLEVFAYHAARDHFSTWLFIHGEHELGRALRATRGAGEATRGAVRGLLADALRWRSKGSE